ncbi:MAG: LysR family transcriptional regulator [Acidobacteria bacterium]|nr:LysR family transcriptional regulator [Acidobacteriota bacterium]MCB9398657.1 LysR family transcriptional regulator [Acidobacteriota bacterium]
MELKQLQVLVKVIQTGSFTQAATQLGSQKAQVSRVVSQLETDLGVRLLSRTTRSLSMTEAGKQFYQKALEIIRLADEAQASMAQTLKKPTGLLRLTCGVEFGQIAVTDWINGFLNQFPEVRIEAEFTNRLVDLVAESYDLAIRVGQMPDSSLTARQLGRLTYQLYVHPKVPFLENLKHPQALSDLPLLVFSGGSHGAEWVLSDGEKNISIAGTARLKVNNSFAVAKAAVQGMGVALLPRKVADPYCQQGLLLPILQQWAPKPVPVFAVYPSKTYLSPKISAFVEFAAQAFTNLE